MNEQLLNSLPVIYRSDYLPLSINWRSQFYQLLEIRDEKTTIMINQLPVHAEPHEIIFITSHADVQIKGEPKSVRVVQFESSLLVNMIDEKTIYMKMILKNIHMLDWQDFLKFKLEKSNILEQIRVSVRLFSFLLDILDQGNIVEEHILCEENPLLIHFDDSRMLEVVLYMKQQIANPDLSLDHIARVIGYHPNYLCQQFKKIMKITPMKYVARARIEKALDLLRTTDVPIHRICSEIGIKNSSSLSSMVINLVGVTPAEYRKMYRLCGMQPAACFYTTDLDTPQMNNIRH
ncbi:helix-turn-helix transcriptional regulator [Paenibacillus hexagrammi]|uniref:Helix-turn-helix transcriptional regulator n=1 Tax=Paenibacillus hexagrammi TaxID=2908839 RepID=A0ABY3SFA3_9BACL|nr:response regulator transcription factor [Paenibacillus sp. YPD9-1]UJF31836.1 helix-turn-helix transcriptional regulator [Paenibacillus sp. YPD9-1]